MSARRELELRIVQDQLRYRRYFAQETTVKNENKKKGKLRLQNAEEIANSIVLGGNLGSPTLLDLIDDARHRNHQPLSEEVLSKQHAHIYINIEAY